MHHEHANGTHEHALVRAAHRAVPTAHGPAYRPFTPVGPFTPIGPRLSQPAALSPELEHAQLGALLVVLVPFRAARAARAAQQHAAALGARLGARLLGLTTLGAQLGAQQHLTPERAVLGGAAAALVRRPGRRRVWLACLSGVPGDRAAGGDAWAGAARDDARRAAGDDHRPARCGGGKRALV